MKLKCLEVIKEMINFIKKLFKLFGAKDREQAEEHKKNILFRMPKPKTVMPFTDINVKKVSGKCVGYYKEGK